MVNDLITDLERTGTPGSQAARMRPQRAWEYT